MIDAGSNSIALGKTVFFVFYKTFAMLLFDALLLPLPPSYRHTLLDSLSDVKTSVPILASILASSRDCLR